MFKCCPACGSGSFVSHVVHPYHLRATSAPLPRHFRATSAPLPRHFRATSAPLPRRFRATSAPLPRHFRATSAPLPRHFCAAVFSETRCLHEVWAIRASRPTFEGSCPVLSSSYRFQRVFILCGVIYVKNVGIMVMLHHSRLFGAISGHKTSFM